MSGQRRQGSWQGSVSFFQPLPVNWPPPSVAGSCPPCASYWLFSQPAEAGTRTTIYPKVSLTAVSLSFYGENGSHTSCKGIAKME